MQMITHNKPSICYCAAGSCSAPKPEWCIGRRHADGWREAVDEFGWLLESEARDDRPIWFTLGIGDYSHEWTTDNMQALRFARREDAEYFANKYLDGGDQSCWATEHVWTCAPKQLGVANQAAARGKKTT